MRKHTRLLKDEDLRALLSSSGLRVTEQRMAALQELAKLRVPTSHGELAERLGPRVDKVTVYRTLLSLTEAGILVRTQLGDGLWRFELPRSTDETHAAHPHFVCTDCGDVSCLPAGAVTLHTTARVAEVQLRGVCKSCEGED